MVSLAFAAGRTKKLKLGTSVQVLPGRNPVLLAKQWASLDVLSGGRPCPRSGSASSTRTSSRRSASPARNARRGSTRRSR